MRPPRDDIAAPVLPPRIRWRGERPRPIDELTASGPLLVHFLDVAQLGSVRSLPYIRAWESRYRDHGLAVLGVHSPRFAFTADPELIAAELERLGVGHPVAEDLRYEIWHDYDPGGWPALFLWDRGGFLRWAHFGEGAYRETEAEIVAALGLEQGPPPLDSIRPTDAEAALLGAPSAEILPGGSTREPATETLEIEYEAGGAHIALDGGGRIGFSVDGSEPLELRPDRPGLHDLVEHPHHGRHRLLIEPRDGARIWSVAFSAGLVPGEDG